jgi:ADP-ribose pyrophosphatase YjhB (NUDIX family)
MEIKSTLKNRLGQTLEVIYHEGVDPTDDLGEKILQASHAFCFHKDKLVVVYAESKKYWTPPGGGIEHGETYEQAVVREIKEETNMKVLYQELIGFHDIYEPDRIIRQTRSFCIVEPYGDFVYDTADGEITEIKLIDPSDYKQYFNWKESGDRIMQRALELKQQYDSRKSLG